MDDVTNPARPRWTGKGRRLKRFSVVAAALVFTLTSGTGLAAPAQAQTPTTARAAGSSTGLPTTGAASAQARVASAQARVGSDPAPRHAPSWVSDGKLASAPSPRARLRATTEPLPAPQVGDVRVWLALDDVNGGYYLKPFQLTGVGEHIEIWVAVRQAIAGEPGAVADSQGTFWVQDLGFPEGSPGACRNEVFDGAEVRVTAAQVDSFVTEFDTTIYPKESEVFSTPVPRDGSAATLTAYYDESGTVMPVPAGNFTGPGDRIVTLVDNVRDANYFDPTTPDGQTYIAGFFSSTFTGVEDRNIMTIDGFDWLHRTGAAPPDDEPIPGCPSAGTIARPHLYEGTFAHEYQHLLENDADPDEVSWVNEGLSDWAQTLVGYTDPSVPVDAPGADSHLACFTGFAEPRFGGPENSLTRWGDQGGPEILCDYGAAYSFMEYLHGRLDGDATMTALHREPANGLEGLNAMVQPRRAGRIGAARSLTGATLLHDWQAAVALDAALQDGGLLLGTPAARRTLQIRSMSARINWANPQAYDSPGAPTNGADYVRLRSADGAPLSARDAGRITFAGQTTYPAQPLEWTVDPTGGPDGGPALASGTGDEVDRAAVIPVDVPAAPGGSGDTTLTFDARYETEPEWDFFFVQVSTDGGVSYQSLPLAGTTDQAAQGAYPTVVANLPGFTGSSNGWVSMQADLSAYAGQTVLVSFRYVTDWAFHEAGVWIDDIAVGDTLISDGSTTSGFASPTQVHPVPVAAWTVQVIGYGEGRRSPVFHATMPLSVLGDRFVGTLRPGDQVALRASRATTVAALVSADDPSEQITWYPRYTLTAGGVTQPGG